MKKAIMHILMGREKRIGKDETVLQPLPHKDFRFANPFIVLHHMRPQQIEAGSEMRLHPHPHRGFAPVTFMLQGEGYHKDNAGHNEIVREGGVQWMFAGKGILHSEGPTKELLASGGVQELIQLWINVPAAHKWDDPTYQSAARDQLPQVMQQEGVSMRLATGSYDGKTGPVKTLTDIISMVGEINKGARVQFNAIPGYWTLLYVASGKLCIDQEPVDQYNLVVFEKNNNEIIFSAEEDARILFLSAEPLDEPVAAKDNFVMNTQEEVEQAMSDYNNGLFGNLEY